MNSEKPDSLQTLGLKVVVDRLIDTWIQASEEEQNGICNQISTILCQSPLHIYADETTEIALTALQRRIFSKELLAAMISENVTTLKISMLPLVFYVKKCDRCSVAKHIWEKIGKLEHLKKLSVGGREEDLMFAQFPRHLEVVHFHGSTDRTLAILAYSCPKVKILDLSLSNVTNISTTTLAKFKHLEQLDIIKSDITSEGFPLLSTGLSEKLKNFSCCSVRVSDINLLAVSGRFHNLSQLYVNGLICDTIFAKGLDSLWELSIDNATQCPDLLKNIGHNLTSLKLTDVLNVDILILDQYCPNLECLKLSHVTALQHCHSNPAPSFQSLRQFHYQCNKFCCWCLLQKCTRLQSLSLQIYCSMEDKENDSYEQNVLCLKRLLSTSQLSALRELDIFFPGNVTFMWELLSHCKGLKILRMKGFASFVIGLKSLMLSVQESYPNMEVMISSSSNSVV